MAPGLPIENVHDLAWLLMEARHFRIAIEEAEGVEFVFRFPLDHPPHLPGWILARSDERATAIQLCGSAIALTRGTRMLLIARRSSGRQNVARASLLAVLLSALAD